MAGLLGSVGVELPHVSSQPYRLSPEPDLTTIDATIDGLYASISGPIGQERDWDLYDAVFSESARMTAFMPGANGELRLIEMTPAEYKDRSGSFLKDAGFTEKESHRVSEIYGSIAHVWSTYHGTYTNNNHEHEVEGINSIQLIKIEGQWKVSNIMWESTQTAGEIPKKYAGE